MRFNHNGTNIFRGDIPVLSEQTTLTEPRASTDGSFLTIALRRDIRKTPKARVTVVTIGKPSGIAATANDTGKRNFALTK